MSSQLDQQEAWQLLSDSQRAAARWDEGPLLLLAGPGSGKTRVLTSRVSKLLLESGSSTFRILCLTFTNKAADEMHTRIRELVGDIPGRLFLGTFHSFCADVLRNHGVHLGIKPSYQIYSRQEELQELLEEAIQEESLDIRTFDSRRRGLALIQDLKSKLVVPVDSAPRFKDPRIGQDVANLYAAYDRMLASRNALDFDSLVIRTFQLLEKYPAFANRYRRVYRYLCVDEFQDTNAAQYRIIKMIAGNQTANIFAVADDDQIIYQWNGASHRRIHEFIRDFTPEVIQLPLNYRCPAPIVELANRLIQHNFTRTPGKMPGQAWKTEAAEGTVRVIGPFQDPDVEVAWIAEDILKNASDMDASTVVLARQRRLLEQMLDGLQARGISGTLAQRRDEFATTPYIWMHSILKLANDRGYKRVLETVCGTFSQMTSLVTDTEDVVTRAEATNGDYLRSWVEWLAARCGERGDLLPCVEAVTAHLVAGENHKAFCKWAEEWFAEKWRSSGEDNGQWAGLLEDHRAWRDLIRVIDHTIGTSAGLNGFLQELQMHSKEPAPPPGSVQLLTIHGSKGKEFGHVYVMGMVDDQLPSYQSVAKGPASPEMEEERRNCFVAITRATESLTLTWSQRYNGWSKRPSRFLYEMGVLEQAA